MELKSKERGVCYGQYQIAVVIQLMVQSEISGVLFTADPITGSYGNMIGNYVRGLGEQLVSGEADAYPFQLTRPKGKYDGPEAFQKYAAELYKFAARLEMELGSPQDIEWAVAEGKLYLLQARPITTLTPGKLDTYEINESLTGDASWVNTNESWWERKMPTPFYLIWGDTELASLGPVVGISKVIKGEMSREEYLIRYGHRGPHEFELSIPGPAEDADWLERQIEEFEKSDTDVEGLLKKQHTQYEAALKCFKERYLQKVKWLEKQIAKASEGARVREAARSEFVRVFRVMRSFALKTGELTRIGDGVFFLYFQEAEELLAGRSLAVEHIPARRENYEKYKALPPFPSIIRGRFNPFEWPKDPNRRMDYYDSTLPVAMAPNSETLKGFAGAAGRVEGIVRILANPEDGEKLQPGEILVATTTNVGWTPLFPKATAIITDVGAPLSHAAIVPGNWVFLPWWGVATPP